MTEFSKTELIFLNKLLNKVKYENLNSFELNQFSNSPIGNSILEKIQSEFEPQFTEIKKQNESAGITEFRFEFDNYVGKAITKRLNHMDINSFQEISGWNESETEKFAKDIIGPIKYEQSELKKLAKFLKDKSNEKTD
jgi:hypothetical protein